MDQSQRITAALKQFLKEKGVTYAMLAQKFRLSEASVGVFGCVGVAAEVIFVTTSPIDRGREGLSPSPSSEPCVWPKASPRFSRTRLSSQWFPHRDWLADVEARVTVNSPNPAKYAFGQRL